MAAMVVRFMGDAPVKGSGSAVRPGKSRSSWGRPRDPTPGPGAEAIRPRQGSVCPDPDPPHGPPPAIPSISRVAHALLYNPHPGSLREPIPEDAPDHVRAKVEQGSAREQDRSIALAAAAPAAPGMKLGALLQTFVLQTPHLRHTCMQPTRFSMRFIHRRQGPGTYLANWRALLYNN